MTGSAYYFLGLDDLAVKGLEAPPFTIYLLSGDYWWLSLDVYLVFWVCTLRFLA